MSTIPVTISNKEFKYELVSYKGGTEDLLRKNLESKFGKNSIDVLFRSGAKVNATTFINNAKDNGQSEKEMLAGVETIVKSAIVNKLNSLYGKKNTDDQNGNGNENDSGDDEGEEVVNDDLNESGKILEAEGDNRPPVCYALWNSNKYAYITMAMQENIWELFNSDGARFGRLIAGWWNAIKNKDSREKIGKWLMSTVSPANLGVGAAVDWLGNKLQSKIDSNRQRKNWKQADKNRRAANKFDKKEEKRREKELANANGAGNYRSFETAVDYEGYKSRKHDQILNRGLKGSGVRSSEARHDKWRTENWRGTLKQYNDTLVKDFGEKVIKDKIQCGNNGPKFEEVTNVNTSRADAANILKKKIQIKTNNKERYFLAAPYQEDNNVYGYFIKADNETGKWLNKNPPSKLEENMNNSKTIISFNQFKKLIMESIVNENKSNIQGLEYYSEDEIKEMVLDQVHERLRDAGIDDSEFNVKAVAIYGSRRRGTARKRSDLDVVIEYTGSMREDDAFDIINDKNYEYGNIAIDSIKVDVNPIRSDKSGSIEDFLKRADEYDKMILSQKQKQKRKR